jgi:dTDP-4-dehydrorhamnose reductase
VQGSVLVIGGSGMLGRAVQASLRSRGWTFQAPPRADLDLSRPETIASAVPGYGVVINCAAWTDVDGAEAHEQDATRLNGHAVGDLAAACLRHGAGLVHYSTDYVFDGRGTSPYPVDASINPVNAYGRSKAVGEKLIAEARDRGLRAMVLRTSWLYAPWGKNFVRTIARFAREKPSLRVVNDQRGRPTSSEHLAKATLAMVQAGGEGVFHVTDGGQATWYDFAVRIAAAANPSCRVEPCTSGEYPRPAARPAYSVLDLSRIEALIGPRPAWQDELDSVMARLEP